MAEREEALWLSAKQRDRRKVLREVKKRRITQKRVGAELGLSERWIRELPGARKRGDEELFREKNEAKLWHDCAPMLAAEELAVDYGIAISRESLRKWLIEGKLWRAKRNRVERTHLRRPRGRVMASWCNGTRANTIGWKGVRKKLLDIDDR